MYQDNEGRFLLVDTNQKHTPFSTHAFSNKFISLIKENSKVMEFPAKQIIENPGSNNEYFYFIEKGSVRITVSSAAGEEIIIKVLGESSCFGEAILLAEKNNMFFITDKPSVIYRMYKDDFFKLFNESPDFRITIAKNLAGYVLDSTYRIESYAFQSSKQRLIDLFEISADTNSRFDHDWCKLKFQFSQNDMAKLIGVTKFTINKLMKELREDGIIRVVNNEIEIEYDCIKD